MGAEECMESTLFKYESAGGLVVEAVLLAYLFYVMMVLTDEYLMGTWHIEYIDISIHKFHLSTTAGACLVLPTQIAFGSIVPEFTVNTISALLVSKQHSILGLSTIIGSGCFGKDKGRLHPVYGSVLLRSGNDARETHFPIDGSVQGLFDVFVTVSAGDYNCGRWGN